jgi:hypothetical protein
MCFAAGPCMSLYCTLSACSRPYTYTRPNPVILVCPDTPTWRSTFKNSGVTYWQLTGPRAYLYGGGMHESCPSCQIVIAHPSSRFDQPQYWKKVRPWEISAPSIYSRCLCRLVASWEVSSWSWHCAEAMNIIVGHWWFLLKERETGPRQQTTDSCGGKKKQTFLLRLKHVAM